MPFRTVAFWRERWRSLPVAAGMLAMLSGCGDPSPRPFVRTDAPVIAIEHVRVIDGTGTPSRDDQTVVIRAGQIASVQPASASGAPAGAAVIDGRGRTLIPGLVGMHEHLFYQMGEEAWAVQAAFARLYLASGVTTIRTAGTFDFKGDARLKADIDAGRLPGPNVHLTSPFLNTHAGAPDPAATTREVDEYADEGATSFKAYKSLRAAELKAAIEAAHARGLQVTGHLCAVGFNDAVEMGIDNLEHGLAVDTEFYSGREADVCPDQGAVVSELTNVDIATDVGVRRLVENLVRHGVAITSTLAIFDTFTGDSESFDPRMPEVLASRLRNRYDKARVAEDDRDTPTARLWSLMLAREMAFERLFVDAGGRLMAGADPTGWGGIVAGFGDQRELELLVQAGLTPEMAIRVATMNGANFLREGERIGTIETGRQADLVLVRGNLAKRMTDIRNVEIVFKAGVGYDSAAIIAASAGTVGAYSLRPLLEFPINLILLALVLILGIRIVQGQAGRPAARATASAQGAALR